MIIALSGYGRSGKDTVADILVEEYGFYKYAWADMLRIAAQELNPIVAFVDNQPFRYNDAIDECGYNEAKVKYPEIRTLLQRLGTEVGRGLIGDTVWVDATLKRIRQERYPNENIVLADTRFLNEADTIRYVSDSRHNKRNCIVRVTRPGIGPAGDHPSETDLDQYDFDHIIYNDGTHRDLTNEVATLCKKIGIIHL